MQADEAARQTTASTTNHPAASPPFQAQRRWYSQIIHDQMDSEVNENSLNAWAWRTASKRAGVEAFADDTYVTTDVRVMYDILQGLITAFKEVGLELHPDKTNIWAPGVPDAEFPEPLQRL